MLSVLWYSKENKTMKCRAQSTTQTLPIENQVISHLCAGMNNLLWWFIFNYCAFVKAFSKRQSLVTWVNYPLRVWRHCKQCSIACIFVYGRPELARLSKLPFDTASGNPEWGEATSLALIGLKAFLHQATAQTEHMAMVFELAHDACNNWLMAY